MVNPKIQLRHDTGTNFTSANPVLLEGEFAYETDTKKIKVGDGTTAYASLGYVVDPTTTEGLQEAIDSLEEEYTSITTQVENKQDKLNAGDNIEIGYEVINPNVQPNWGSIQNEWVTTNVNNLFSNLTQTNWSLSFRLRKQGNFNGLNSSLQISNNSNVFFTVQRGDDDFTVRFNCIDQGILNFPVPNTGTTYFQILITKTTNNVQIKITREDTQDTRTINVGDGSTVIFPSLVNNLTIVNQTTNLLAIERASVKLYNGKQQPQLVISADQYTLPPATASTLGGIKVGSGLTITADGTLSSTTSEGVPEHTHEYTDITNLQSGYARLFLTGANDAGQIINPATTFQRPININGGVTYAGNNIISVMNNNLQINGSGTNGTVQLGSLYSGAFTSRLTVNSNGVIFNGTLQKLDEGQYYRLLDERDLAEVTALQEQVQELLARIETLETK